MPDDEIAATRIMVTVVAFVVGLLALAAFAFQVVNEPDPDPPKGLTSRAGTDLRGLLRPVEAEGFRQENTPGCLPTVTDTQCGLAIVDGHMNGSVPSVFQAQVDAVLKAGLTPYYQDVHQHRQSRLVASDGIAQQVSVVFSEKTTSQVALRISVRALKRPSGPRDADLVTAAAALAKVGTGRFTAATCVPTVPCSALTFSVRSPTPVASTWETWFTGVHAAGFAETSSVTERSPDSGGRFIGVDENDDVAVLVLGRCDRRLGVVGDGDAGAVLARRRDRP